MKKQQEHLELAILNDDEAESYMRTWTAIKAISGKWKPLIIWQICNGQVRFNELRRLIPKASQKMLSQQLRELEEDGLIKREVYPEKPPRVEYSLTELGIALEPVFHELEKWGHLFRNVEA